MDVVQPFRAPFRADIQHSHRRGQHQLAAVPQPPGPTQIGTRVEGARIPRRHPIGKGARERRRVVVSGSGHGVRRLRQDADHVVEVRRGPHAPVPPGVEFHPRDRAPLALLLEPTCHGVADEIDTAHDQRGNMRVHGFSKRRHEDPGGKWCRLMVVVDNLREPFVIELARRVLRLGHVEHEPVAIVIVTRIRVVQLGCRRTFERRSHVIHVPLGHERRAIRIHVRDQQEDHVVSNEPRLFAFVRRHAIRQERGGLRVSDLVRVQAEIDPDDGASLLGQKPRVLVGQVSRQGQPLRDLLIPASPLEVLFRRDERHDLRPALDRPADIHEQDPGTRSIEPAEVGGDFLVGGQLVVRAGRKPDHAFRRWRCLMRGRGDLGRGSSQRDDSDSQAGRHPSSQEDHALSG